MTHPYAQFENTRLWNAIEVAIADLEKNTDIKLETSRDYIIGSLCKQLISDGVAAHNSFARTDSDSN